MLKHLQKLGKHRYIVLARIVIAAIAIIVDPLGAGQSESKIFDDKISWTTGNIFPREQSEKIAVVLIDEQDLSNDAFQQDWPFTYDKTANIIHAIACNRAAGVFFDYALSSRYDTSEHQQALRDAVLHPENGAVCDNDEAPTKLPVFFGKIDSITTELSNWINGIERSYPIVGGPGDWAYPVRPQGYADGAVDASSISPAFAVLKAACSSDTAMPTICDQEKVSRLQDNQLRLSWSPSVSTAQKLVSSDTGPIASCRPPLGILQIFMTFARRLKPLEQKCFPILTLRARDLFRNSAFVVKYGNPASVLKDRFVFVGTDLAGLNDTVNSPIHGNLPGVYKHAVALENLVSTEFPYPTIPPEYVVTLLGFTVIFIMEISRVIIETFNGRPIWRLVMLGVTSAGYGALIIYNAWPLSLMLTMAYYIGSVGLIELLGFRETRSSKRRA